MKKHSPNNIYLVGFMGAGKSTIGPLLAASLKWTFVDSDKEIERVAGNTITEIFKTQGEDIFRNLEGQVVQEISNRSNCVVSLGGGALIRPHNLELVRQTGVIIYLRASITTLIERIEIAKRPLLMGHDGNITEQIKTLLATRKPQYETAHITIDTDGKMPHNVNELILRKLESCN